MRRVEDTRLCLYFLSPQHCQQLLNDSDLGFGISFLLAFLVNDGGRMFFMFVYFYIFIE
jgi:hypothetical protein